MLPEEQARAKIDKQLRDAGWHIITRNEFSAKEAVAVKEALMQGNKESDYLLYIEGKAIAVIEAKRESNNLGIEVQEQVEYYANHPQNWDKLWFDNLIPLVYVANGNKILFKNLLKPEDDYVELSSIHSPKKMLKLIDKTSDFGALPLLEKEKGNNKLRDCQYEAIRNLELSIKNDNRKNLTIIATGAGKTYLACMASYRLLNYTRINRVLFLVDRNNLGVQAQSEFSMFSWTEENQSLSSLYEIKRLKKNEDINANIVISTIQKLYAVLTGQQLTDDINEDAEDEQNNNQNDEESIEPIKLGENLELPPDYFQFIVVDECHRSIYGKWKAVLDYFSDAFILGLTATPTPEATSFFEKIIEKYTNEDSVNDGVNVPPRVYRISTKVTEHGGTIENGSEVKEIAKSTNITTNYVSEERVEYNPNQLDRSVINPNQIKLVLSTFRNSIYTELYPERTEDWYHIPKTLIFAKIDKHADEIVSAVKEVFKSKFPNEEIPENFVQKITYSAGDSNKLIRDFRTEKEFRIAVTVNLVATGTDIKPLEIVLFMKDVQSDVLYTQMKGRGCRTIDDDKLKEVTPNANTKECYYIVDAVGVTEHSKNIPGVGHTGGTKRVLTLESLIEHLAHEDVNDENLILLSNYCATINHRYENNPLFSKHLREFITNFHFSPRDLAKNITAALNSGRLPPFIKSGDNTSRKKLIACLIDKPEARKKLIEMQHGYLLFSEDEDQVSYAGLSKENAKSFIANLENYLVLNKDKVEALRIIYNTEKSILTYKMLTDLRDKLLSENRSYTSDNIWKNYQLLDNNSQVEKKAKIGVLTDLIQIVRFAYKQTEKLTSISGSYLQRFNLYCGQAQRELSDAQKQIMREIALYIADNGSISFLELNKINTNLWRSAIIQFKDKNIIETEMNKLSNFILKVA